MTRDDLIKLPSKTIYKDDQLVIVCTDLYFEIYYQVDDSDEFEEVRHVPTDPYLIDPSRKRPIDLARGAVRLAQKIDQGVINL